MQYRSAPPAVVLAAVAVAGGAQAATVAQGATSVRHAGVAVVRLYGDQVHQPVSHIATLIRYIPTDTEAAGLVIEPDTFIHHLYIGPGSVGGGHMLQPITC